VKSSLEPLEGNKVKLSVDIDEDEFDRNIDQAFRKISREVRLPGFRAGKAPRRVLEARIGLAPAREQALRDSIPVYLAKAVREHDVDLIASPEVEITAGEEDGPVGFDATCEVRPEVTVPGYAGLRVELPSPEADDDEVTVAAEAELKRHGSLTDADRPAAPGDFLTIDLVATRDDDEVPGLNTEGWSYELGQGWVAEEFDEQLTGAQAGDMVAFTATPKGTEEEADFEVTVTAVQELVLPEVDDDWVAENVGEFETVEEWHAGLRQRISAMKLNQLRQQLIDRVTSALVELADIEAPETMVTSDLQRRVEGTIRQFQSQGISMEQWFSATGQDANTFVENLRGQSEQAAKADLALRAVATAEALEAEDGDLEDEYRRLSVQMNEKPNRVRKAYEDNDLVPELTAQIRKSKALDWLIHHVELVDPLGNVLDRDLVLGHAHGPDGEHLDDDEQDHDHDHDHEGPPDDTQEPDMTDDTSRGEPLASSEASGASPR